jgi:hypothetical protein
MAVMNLLLLFDDQGWASTSGGNFRYEREVADWIGLSSRERIFGYVLLGVNDEGDVPSASLARLRRRRAERVHVVGETS